MARLPEFQPLYDTFQQFLERCVLDNRSLLWPGETVWTPENVAEVKRRVVDAPILKGELSFEEKLQEQMKGAPAQQWLILADIYYIYFLPSNYIKLEKKEKDIRWASQQGGLTPPLSNAEIWAAQKVGFTRTSQKYHYKYAQFWLILLFVDRLKREADAAASIRDAQQVRHIFDELLESLPNKVDRANDMRHAMLYLAFPDQYERIISTRDKQRIVEAYRQRIQGAVPTDLDEALRQIRAILAPQYDQLDRPFDFYMDLMSEWRPINEPPVDDKLPGPQVQAATVNKTPVPKLWSILTDEDVAATLSILNRTHNVILYGPPGTGKTYIAKKVAEALVEAQIRQPLSEPALIQRVIEPLTSYEQLALAMYLGGSQKHYTIIEILAQPIVQARYQVSPVKYPQQNLWSRLQEHTSPQSETVKVANRGEPYLFDKDKDSRWFLTEIGRAYVEANLAQSLADLRSQPAPKSATDFIMWATFHQSYTYEDFVEGLRPIQSDENPGEISYPIVPGVFKRICKLAAVDPNNKYVLIIDEINRGNIAKILGELITLLEDDKRAGQPNALAITLPYSGEPLTVPGNLYLIGTMNTADRSIALLDMALRRRFAFIELMPRPELLAGVKIESQEASVPLDGLLRSLNQGIRRYLDRDHQIGHSYFLTAAQANPDQQVETLEFIWNNQITPLLDEYFYSQREKLAELLAPFYPDMTIDRIGPAADRADLELKRLQSDDLMVALAKLAERSQVPPG